MWTVSIEVLYITEHPIYVYVNTCFDISTISLRKAFHCVYVSLVILACGEEFKY